MTKPDGPQWKDLHDDTIPAGHLIWDAEPRLGEEGHNETTNEMWNRKLKETQGSGLYTSIANHGVKKPIDLWVSDDFVGYTIINGHHRLAAANDIDEDMKVPVKYHRR